MTALYGLPEEVKFCKRCVISNQRPSSAIEYQHTSQSKKVTIQFDSEGICSACRAAEQKAKTDWAERERELIELCNRYRKTDGSYDCLVPGSGGKDSVYQSHMLKYKYGMHPLTVTWAPNLYTDVGRRNHEAWINGGFDNYLCTPNGKTHRLLTRLAVQNLFHPFQCFMLGQKSLAPKLAVLFDIPLIFYGENESEYGNPIADLASSRRDHAYYTSANPSNVFLGGVSIADLKAQHGLSDNDLLPYLPADPEVLTGKGIQVHYLGYYLKWHPQSCFYFASDRGFQCSTERTPGTYSKYNSVDDKIDDLHYWTTYIKYGIGRATYDAAQEIRSGDITREEGVALVKRYDGEWPARFEQELSGYLGITKNELFDLADRFRSPHLWDSDKKLKHTVFA